VTRRLQHADHARDRDRGTDEDDRGAHVELHGASIGSCESLEKTSDRSTTTASPIRN
jgi:hypothetical protein